MSFENNNDFISCLKLSLFFFNLKNLTIKNIATPKITAPIGTKIYIYKFYYQKIPFYMVLNFSK